MVQPLSQGQRELNYLVSIGIDPEDAAYMLEAGTRDPSMMPYIPEDVPFAGLDEDGRRAVAELQNMDETRNAGSRNRKIDRPSSEYDAEDLEGVSTGSRGRVAGTEGLGLTADPFGFNTIRTDRDPGRRRDMSLPMNRAPALAAEEMVLPDGTVLFGEGPVDFDYSAAPTWVEDPRGGPLPDPEFKRPPPVSTGAGTGGTSNPGRQVNAELSPAAPADDVKPNPMNPVQSFFADKFGMDEDARSDLGRALLMGGLATMAGTSPYAMENIGKGGLVGAEAYFNAGDEREAGLLEQEQLAMEREMHELRKSEIQQKLAAGEISIEQAEAELEAGINGGGLYGGLPEDLAEVEQTIDYYISQGYTKDEARELAYRIFKMRDTSPDEAVL